MPANQSFFDSEDFQIPLVIYLILICIFEKPKTGGLFINKIKEPPEQHQLGTETRSLLRGGGSLSYMEMLLP